jgi:hypothetical protein
MSAQENGAALAQRSPADIEAPITGGEMETLWRLARGLADSGFFKDAKQGTQAFAKLVFGRDLGLSATQAMTDIHIVEGKPEASANLQAAKIKGSGRYDYRVIEHSETKCSIEFGPAPAPMRGEDGAWLSWPSAFGVAEFTIEQAKQAGLVHKTSGGHTGMWEKYPRNMLFARAISNGTAWYCPDVMNGIRVYAEGEIREAREVERPSAAAGATPAEASEGSEEIADAEVVESPALDDEQREELAKAIEASGVDVDLLLSACGLESLEQVTEAQRLQVSQKIAELIGGVNE